MTLREWETITEGGLVTDVEIPRPRWRLLLINTRDDLVIVGVADAQARDVAMATATENQVDTMDSAAGDILILQFPRQPGTYSCGSNLPCHGRLFTGVSLFEHDDGVAGWTADKYFEIQSGTVVATEVGPTMLRGTFQVEMEMPYGEETLQITDGRIHVTYNATPPAPGQSHRGIECLLRLAEGQPVVCN